MTAKAQWTNFPAAQGNTNGYEWEQIRTNWIQLLLAANERTKVLDPVFVPTASNGFVVSGTYTVPAGITNVIGSWKSSGFPDPKANADFALIDDSRPSLFINPFQDPINGYDYYLYSNGPAYFIMHDALYTNADGYASTNWYAFNTTNRVTGVTVFTSNTTNTFQLHKNIVMTNLNLTPYSYTDETGTYTATGYPYVTQAQMASLDAQITTLIPYYVDHTQADSNGTFNTWFESNTNDFPMWSKTNIFTSLGIGLVNSNAYFTRYPVMTNQWLLYEVAYTGVWTQNSIGTKALLDYETVMPVAKYTTAGTNPIGSYSFVISGNIITASNQAISASTEAITVTSSNTACTKLWYSITNISCVSTAANMRDWLSVSYTNAHPVYGAAPYEIYSADLDERWKVLNALRWTRINKGDPGNFDLYGGNQPNKANDLVYDTYAGAIAEAEGATVVTNGDYGDSGIGEFTWSEGHPTSGGFYITGIGWTYKDYTYNSLYTNLTPNIFIYTSTTNAYPENSLHIIVVTNSTFDMFSHTNDYGSNCMKTVQGSVPWEITSSGSYTDRIGTATYPATHSWRSAPSTNGAFTDYTATGFRINRLNWLLKWDSTNSITKFVFK